MTPINDSSRSSDLTQENINNMVESGYQSWYEKFKKFLHNILKNE